MLVYRVENANGLGPYQYALEAFSGAGDMCSAHGDKRHPGPWHPESDLNGINSREFCGLDSPQALLEWFYDFLVDLDADGFHVSVYSTEEVRVGRYGQALFPMADAELVNRMTCEELFDLI